MKNRRMKLDQLLFANKTMLVRMQQKGTNKQAGNTQDKHFQ